MKRLVLIWAGMTGLGILPHTPQLQPQILQRTGDGPAQFSKLRNYQIWGQDGQLYIFSSPAAPLSHPSLKIEIMLFWTLSRLDSARVMVTLVTSPCGDYWPPPMGLLTIISDCNRLLSTTVELSRTWLRYPLCFVLFHENLLNVRSYLNNLFLVTKPFFM